MIIRPSRPADAPAMAELLNTIIAIGGTTAHQTLLNARQIDEYYISGPAVVCSHVAENQAGLLGFQSLDKNPGLPPLWADIGTFVQPLLQKTGVGQALFAANRAAAFAAGVIAINATIRCDNAPGLAYYARVGFVDYAHDPDFKLRDGTRTGRVSRRFNLT